MKVKTSELQGTALDWAVAKCIHLINGDDLDIGFIKEYGYTPSTDWAQGGPIIEREEISIEFGRAEFKSAWIAYKLGSPHEDNPKFGSTPLIAAMRCYVASKLGDEVDVPDELMEGE